MNTAVMRRALALLAVLTACGSAQTAREPREEGEPASVTAGESGADQPHASGAAAYVPPPVRLPEGAIDRTLLDRVIAAGPGWLLAEVPLQPTFLAKHKFNGFKLVSVFRNDPKVLRYGVLPGDIIRAINGQKVVTPGDLLLVFERVKVADTLEIVVDRGGVERQFRFPIVPPLGLAATAPPPADVTATSAP